MTEQIHSADLPVELPIFPLTGVLLLPHAQLPLNIFEPRYLAMTEDALAKGRYIGMIQPQEAAEENNQENPGVYKTGCAGRIISFSESGGGRFLITLLGVCRFQITEELGLVKGYRRVRANYESFIGDLKANDENLPGRDERLKTVQSYLALKNINADWSSIENAPDEPLVNSLAMMCPFAPSEKQALLECSGLQERSTLLMSLMNMAVHDIHEGPATQTH